MGYIHWRYGQDRTQIEEIIGRAKIRRTRYLQESFWPACGTISGVLLFFAAAVILPP
jgi:CHAD domain-containing protein